MTPAGDVPGGAPRPARHGAVAALVVYTILFFAPAVMGGQFFFRDASQNHYPLRQFEVESGLASPPLWNPHLSFGQPALANPNYGVLHPTRALFALMPFDAAFRWGVIAQILLAATGTFLLLRDLRASPQGALLAAIAAAFTGPMLSLGNLQNVLASAAWMPLALWLLNRAGRPGAGWLVGAAAALAVLIVGGEPLTLAATLCFAAVLALWGRPWVVRGAAGCRDWRGVAAIPVALALGLALAAVQLLPTLELLPHSERGAGFGWEEAARWSTHPLRLLELLVPGPFGDPTALDPMHWWGEGFFESSIPFLLGIYVGGPVLLLASAAIFLPRRRPLDIALAVASAGLLLVALGRHGGVLAALHALVPGAAAVRYPSKLLTAVAFGLALLAARGLDRLDGASSRTVLRRVVMPAAVAAIVAGVGARILAASPPAASAVLHGALRAGGAIGGPRDAAASAGMAAALLHAAVVTAMAAALIGVWSAGRLRWALAAWGILGLTAVDLYATNGHLNPTVERAWYRVEPRFLETIREIDPGGRIYRFPRPRGFALRSTGDSMASVGFLWDRVSLRNATGLSYGLNLAFDRNNDRLHPAASARAALRLADGVPLARQVRLWKLGATRFVVAYEELEHPELRLVDAVRGESNHPLLLYEVSTAPARARLVPAAMPAASLEEALERVESGAVDPAEVVLLPAAAAGDGGAAVGEPCGSGATVARDEPDRVEVVTRCAAAAWLVLSDSHFPGWSVEVDGKPGRIDAAYFLFRAVRLEAGEHRVVFRYRPTAVRAGAWVSGAALLASLGLVLAGRLRRRRRPGAA